jgi:peptidylprolyl isomerase
MIGIASSLLVIGSVASAQQAITPAMEVLENAPEEVWRTPDLENTLYMDLPSGRIVIELRPDFAPIHVERIKQLTRQGFYDGVLFHRVIEGFMAQGGDPTATGTGGSDLPDIPGEFMRSADAAEGFVQIGRDSLAARVGFIGPVPVASQPDTLKAFLVRDELPLWGLHCKGVMSMARAGDPNSANSQFFLMFGDSRESLDQRYTVWGKIIDGGENARRINRGEPPARPTPIKRMRVAADVPPDERDDVRVMRTDTPEFMDYLKKAGRVTEDGFIEDICNVDVPSKVNGKVEL